MNKQLFEAMAGAWGKCEMEGMKRATLKTFESEEDFIAHARRLIALKPGNVVTIEGEGTCVFAGDDKGRARLFYLNNDKELCTVLSPYGSIMEVVPA